MFVLSLKGLGAEDYLWLWNFIKIDFKFQLITTAYGRFLHSLKIIVLKMVNRKKS